MTTAALTPVNGQPRPLPELGDWRPVEQDSPIEPLAAPAVDHVALAEAAAIRDRAAAEAEARRIKAAAEAKATETLAEENARKLRLANDKAERRAREEQVASEARIAESKRKKDEADRLAREARQAEETEKAAEKATANQEQEAESSWRFWAIVFAAGCAVVALPVQMAAFWSPDRPWMLAAPIMLEGAAWVVLQGAAAAVAARRPHWHFRLIAWVLAFVAAGINLGHGLDAFDVWTAVGTSIASIAGPGVWDLYEHGRIRKRDGVPSRRERNAQEKADKKQAAEKAAAKRFEAERQAHLENVARTAAEVLDAGREKNFPKVWEHALKLAAALGETTVTESVWRRAHKDIEGTDPGESVDIIRGRNSAARRVEAARSEAPGSKPIKVTSSQRAIQVKGPAKRSSYRPVPPRRKRNDTPKFHPVARALAADAKRQSATANTTPEETR